MHGELSRVHEDVVPAALWDPFGADALDDERLTVTHRGLVRMVTVASRIGARFEREGQPGDPVAWLAAPREMFGGACALTACLERTGFERAIVLSAQGLGLGLDAEPRLLDELLAHEEEDDDEQDPQLCAGQLSTDSTAMPRHDPPGAPGKRDVRGRSLRRRLSTGERLYSSSFVRYDASGRVLCFVAAVVDSERTFRGRIFDRFGAIAALGAPVMTGFDQYDQIAARLLSEHVVDRLACLAAGPAEPTVDGFDVLMEQRA